MEDEKTKAMNRIKEEFKNENGYPQTSCGPSLGIPNEDNIFEWKYIIMGPKDTPYKGGIFNIRIKFPDNFPEKGPIVSFITPIYHPNVNPYKLNKEGVESLGCVYLNILNNWKPEYKMHGVFIEIQSLFYLPNADSPYAFERGDELRYNKNIYEEKCKFFTRKYANFNKFDNIYDKEWDFSYPEISNKK